MHGLDANPGVVKTAFDALLGFCHGQRDVLDAISRGFVTE